MAPVAILIFALFQQDTVEKLKEEAMKANERNAVGSLMTIATAETCFRSCDSDHNGVNDFWTGDVSGLYRCTTDGKTAQKLIELSAAEADAAPFEADFLVKHTIGKPKPKAGYWYCALSKDDTGAAYAQETDKSGKKCRNLKRYAFCTYPSEYGKTGTKTFIVSEGNTIWWADTGGKPVEQWPTDAELAKTWKKMD